MSCFVYAIRCASNNIIYERPRDREVHIFAVLLLALNGETAGCLHDATWHCQFFFSRFVLSTSTNDFSGGDTFLLPLDAKIRCTWGPAHTQCQTSAAGLFSTEFFGDVQAAGLFGYLSFGFARYRPSVDETRGRYHVRIRRAAIRGVMVVFRTVVDDRAERSNSIKRKNCGHQG